VVDEDTLHRLAGDSEELSSILPMLDPLIDKANVGLVHQGCWLENVISALTAHQFLSAGVEVAIDQGEEALGGRPIACGHCFQQLRYRLAGPLGHVALLVGGVDAWARLAGSQADARRA
jgi:hypothetical protein